MNNKKTTWRDDEALRRFQLISPLMDENLDISKKLAIRKQISESHNVSLRSLYRYEKAYSEQGFIGLKPQQRAQFNVTESFHELIQECILLKREVPLRSVNQIIMILEMEGRVAPGVLKRYTVQKHLARAGFSKAHLKKYVQASQSP